VQLLGANPRSAATWSLMVKAEGEKIQEGGIELYFRILKTFSKI
jgi:hypothetical protein